MWSVCGLQIQHSSDAVPTATVRTTTNMAISFLALVLAGD